jgi:hypothetical protein
MKTRVLQFYRRLLAVVGKFPDQSMGKKLQYNAKEVIRLRRYVDDQELIKSYIIEGENVLRIYQILLENQMLFKAARRKA